MFGVGDEAVGVGYDPFAFGVAAGGGVDGGDGDVQAVGVEGGLFGQGAQVEAFAAAGVENRFVGGWGG